jgi:small-conductance mechanosensitive channel
MDGNWPILSDLDGLFTQAAGWLNANLLAGETVPQVLAIAGSFLVARVLVHSLRVRASVLADKIAAQRQQVVLRLRPLGLPIAWALLLWFSLVALRQADVPAPTVQAAVALVFAWIGIRLATSLIASPFWSRAIAIVFVAAAALRVFGLWSATLRILDEMTMTIGAVRLSVLGLIEAMLILAVLWSVGSVAARWLDRWIERLPDLTPSGRVLLGKMLRIATFSVAVILALHTIGVDLTTLAVFSGAVGLGIGFGLQKVFSNLVSGLILLLDRSVKPGDVIALSDHYGWINALGARYVSVVTRDGIEHLIPNEDLISERVENWSHSNNLLRLHAPFGIAYGSDLHQAVAVAEEAARDSPRVLPAPEPRCLVLAFGDSAVDLELRFWINDPRNGVHNVKSQVLMRVWELYHQHGIEFPYPQRDLHLKTAVPVTVVRTTDRSIG